MELFKEMVSKANEFPLHRIHTDLHPSMLDTYSVQLKLLEKQLFCNESKAGVDIWECRWHEYGEYTFILCGNMLLNR